MGYLEFLRGKIGKNCILVPHVITLVFNKNNEVLIEERSDDGYFDFPGGAIEVDELVEEAAKRELFEETGIKTKSLTLFHIYSGPITRYTYYNGDEVSGIDLVYIVRDYEGVLLPQEEEVKSLKFMKLEDIPNKLSPRNQAIISDLKNYQL